MDAIWRDLAQLFPQPITPRPILIQGGVNEGGMDRINESGTDGVKPL